MATRHKILAGKKRMNERDAGKDMPFQIPGPAFRRRFCRYHCTEIFTITCRTVTSNGRPMVTGVIAVSL